MPTPAETRLAELLEVVETPTNKLITISGNIGFTLADIS